MVNLNKLLLLLSLLSLLNCSCEKIDIAFMDADNEADPNISYLDDFAINLSTYKLDSFITSGNNVFMLGTHRDPYFASINSNSYAEITLPAENPVIGKDVIFDSLVLELVPNAAYYGDTNTLFKLSVHKLQQHIANENSDDNNFYYPRIFTHDALPIGEIVTTVNPLKKKLLSIRLSDAIGRDWLAKLKGDDDEVQSQAAFIKYFKGICIKSDSLFNTSLYYLKGDTNNLLLKLHYRERGVVATEKIVSFGYNTANQFNNITYNYSGTPFSAMQPYKRMVLTSAEMNNKAYISNNIPSYAKMSFPGLLSVKELHPYIKVLRAELEVKPAPGTFSYPYQLPVELRLFAGEGDNDVSSMLTDPTTGEALNGNFQFDYLYGRETKYFFDITPFVNEVLSEGHFSNRELFLGAASQSGDSLTTRLVINNQQGVNGIKLKLYVLGL